MKVVTLKKEHTHNGLLHPVGAVIEVDNATAEWMDKFMHDAVIIRDKGETNVLAPRAEHNEE